MHNFIVPGGYRLYGTVFQMEWIVDFIYILHATIQPQVLSFLASSPAIEEILKTKSQLASLLPLLRQIDQVHLYTMALLYVLAIIFRFVERTPTAINPRYWLANFLHWTLFIHFSTHSLFAIHCRHWIYYCCIPVFCVYLYVNCRILYWYFGQVEEDEAVRQAAANHVLQNAPPPPRAPRPVG